MRSGIQDIDSLDFAKGDGLLPAIVQDIERGAVLMLGYMNRDALRETLVRGRVVFFSRSKQRLWEKGETSGNTLQFVSVSADCDRDTLLVQARPVGPACHLGTVTCFGDEPQSRDLVPVGEFEVMVHGGFRPCVMVPGGRLPRARPSGLAGKLCGLSSPFHIT